MAAVGVNCTEIVQVAPGCRVPLPLAGRHVLASEKSDASPPSVIPVIVNCEVPGLVSVMTCAALFVPTICGLKLRLVGAALTSGAMAVPLRATTSGAVSALSVMLSCAVLAPTAAGVNVTVMVQLPPAGIGVAELEVLVSAKSLLFAPVTVMELTVSVFLVLLLERVIDCEALGVPTSCGVGKLSEPGVSVTTGCDVSQNHISKLPEARPSPLGNCKPGPGESGLHAPFR